MKLGLLTRRLPAVYRLYWRIGGRWRVYKWTTLGSPSPAPPPYKWHLIRSFARAFACTALIETGTYLGDSIEMLRSDFDRIWSIEVQPMLADYAARRFRRYPHISVTSGDSAVQLPRVMQEAERERCLFWLDAHYSGGQTGRSAGDTPILAEVAAVLRARQTVVVLIDDAREFGPNDEYPPLEVIRDLASAERFSFSLDHDVIRLVRAEE